MWEQLKAASRKFQQFETIIEVLCERAEKPRVGDEMQRQVMLESCPLSGLQVASEAMQGPPESRGLSPSLPI